MDENLDAGSGLFNDAPMLKASPRKGLLKKRLAKSLNWENSGKQFEEANAKLASGAQRKGCGRIDRSY